MRDRPILLIFATLIAVAPIVWLTQFVAGIEQEIPALDQWTLFKFYYAAATDTASVSQFFAPHENTHVILVPRLILTGLALATNWNLTAESYGTFLLFLITLGGLVYLWKEDERRTPLSFFILITSIYLLCSPVFNLTFLWGGGFFHLLVNAGAVGSVIFLQAAKKSGQSKWIWLAAGTTAMATFSRLEGYALWFVLFPIIFLLPGTPKQRKGRLLGWGAGTAASGAILLYSLTALRGESLTAPPSIALDPETIPLAAATALQLVGRPLAVPLDIQFGMTVLQVPLFAFIIGLIAIVYFLGLSYWNLRLTDEAKPAAASAWIALGVFGLCMADGTAFTRAVLLQKPLAQFVGIKMYSITTVWVIVAALNLLPKGNEAPLWIRRMGLGFAVLVAGTTLLAFVQVTETAYANRNVGIVTRHCWELTHLLDEGNECFYFLPSQAVQEKFEEVGFRKVRRDFGFGAPLDPEQGRVERIDHVADEIILEGWINPERFSGRPSIWISTDRGISLSHWASFTEKTSSQWRWHAEVPSDSMKPQPQVWLYDESASRLTRVGGSP